MTKIWGRRFAGRRADGFMSAFERDVYHDLTGKGLDARYEQTKVEYEVPARPAKYTPDITFASHPMIIEVKGRFMAEDRKKHLLIKQQQPDLDIRFVFQNPNAKLYKGSKTTYAGWCDKHGFKYAKGRVPSAWIDEMKGQSRNDDEEPRPR